MRIDYFTSERNKTCKRCGKTGGHTARINAIYRGKSVKRKSLTYCAPCEGILSFDSYDRWLKRWNPESTLDSKSHLLDKKSKRNSGISCLNKNGD